MSAESLLITLGAAALAAISYIAGNFMGHVAGYQQGRREENDYHYVQEQARRDDELRREEFRLKCEQLARDPTGPAFGWILSGQEMPPECF